MLRIPDRSWIAEIIAGSAASFRYHGKPNADYERSASAVAAPFRVRIMNNSARVFHCHADRSLPSCGRELADVFRIQADALDMSLSGTKPRSVPGQGDENT